MDVDGLVWSNEWKREGEEPWSLGLSFAVVVKQLRKQYLMSISSMFHIISRHGNEPCTVRIPFNGQNLTLFSHIKAIIIYFFNTYFIMTTYIPDIMPFHPSSANQRIS